MNLQVVRYGSDYTVERPSPVHLWANYYNFELPIQSASTPMECKGYNQVAHQVQKTVHLVASHFHAIIDQKGFDDVRDGTLKVRLRNFEFRLLLKLYLNLYPLTQNFFPKNMTIYFANIAGGSLFGAFGLDSRFG